MENFFLYATIAIVFYLLIRWFTPATAPVEREIEEILSREQYKVKGRFKEI